MSSQYLPRRVAIVPSEPAILRSEARNAGLMKQYLVGFLTALVAEPYGGILIRHSASLRTSRAPARVVPFAPINVASLETASVSFASAKRYNKRRIMAIVSIFKLPMRGTSVLMILSISVFSASYTLFL